MSRLPSTRWLIAAGIGVACAIAAVLIAVSLIGSDDGGGGPRTAFATAGLRTFDGVPQSAGLLGDASAPVTLIEYGDLQCPFCARYATETLPTLVREYVRTGKVRMELRPIAFIGPDSPTGVKAVVAAGQQDKLWQMADLLYENQGAENGGWLTEELVKDAAAAVPGLDVKRFAADLDSGTVRDIASALGAVANADGVDQTPFFLIGKTGAKPRRLEVGSLEAGAFRPAIDKLLG